MSGTCQEACKKDPGSVEVGLFTPFCLCVVLHVRLTHPHFKAVEAGQTFGEYQLVTSHWRGVVTKMTHVVLWNAYEKQLSPRRIIELAFLSPQQVANELGLRVETRGLRNLLGKYPVDR